MVSLKTQISEEERPWNRACGTLSRRSIHIPAKRAFPSDFAALTAENVVKIRMGGPEAARETMRAVTEKMLREHLPEIAGVELV